MAPVAPDSIPDDFKQLLPKEVTTIGGHRSGKSLGPVYVLWVFNPQDGNVLVDNPESHHPAKTLTHEDLAKHVPHPHRVHGYAYRIQGGWRITDADHKAVDDQHIIKQVQRELSKVK